MFSILSKDAYENRMVPAKDFDRKVSLWKMFELIHALALSTMNQWFTKEKVF